MDQIQRVRNICASLPGTTEKLSHGEPTFFVNKRVYAACSNNHHNDGHVAVLIPLEPGQQAILLKQSPKQFYFPKYVGVSGWIGIELAQMNDEDLEFHLREAWKLIREKSARKKSRR